MTLQPVADSLSYWSISSATGNGAESHSNKELVRKTTVWPSAA